MNNDGGIGGKGPGATDAAQAIAELSRQLAHPLRITVLAHVAEAGPCPFSELVEAAGVPASQVSNHLAVLRRAGLLITERQGRQSLYRLPNSYVAEVLANLRAAAGIDPDVAQSTSRPDRNEARGCYDHVGGLLGVRLLRTMLTREVLVGDPLGSHDLAAGPAADAVLPAFGVPDWKGLTGSRRRFAYGCPDWTEKAPHLGGALGAALSKGLHDQDFVRQRRGSRVRDLTDHGRQALHELGVEV